MGFNLHCIDYIVFITRVWFDISSVLICPLLQAVIHVWWSAVLMGFSKQHHHYMDPSNHTGFCVAFGGLSKIIFSYNVCGRLTKDHQKEAAIGLKRATLSNAFVCIIFQRAYEYPIWLCPAAADLRKSDNRSSDRRWKKPSVDLFIYFVPFGL